MSRTLIGEGNAIVARCRMPVSCQSDPTAFTVGAERDEVLYRWTETPKFRRKSVGITRPGSRRGAYRFVETNSYQHGIDFAHLTRRNIRCSPGRLRIATTVSPSCRRAKGRVCRRHIRVSVSTALSIRTHQSERFPCPGWAVCAPSKTKRSKRNDLSCQWL